MVTFIIIMVMFIIIMVTFIITMVTFIIPQVNGVNVKDYDCCKIKPLFTQTDKISMTVVRNPLALGDHQVATPTSQSNDVISSSQPIEEDDDPSRFIS
jgi:hypothetical protein